MEKIRLSKDERQILRMLAKGIRAVPSDMPYEKYIMALISLRGKGMVQYTPLTTGRPWNIAITEKGRAYLYEKPSLRNYVDWGMILGFCAIALFLATIAFALAGIFKQ